MPKGIPDHSKQLPVQGLKLSLIVPCYNEQERIGVLFQALAAFVHTWKHDYEIIIVDDGSTDNVVAAIRDNAFFQQQEQSGKFILHECGRNQGKGNALKEGVALAKGTHILTMDADLSYKPDEVINWLKQKGDFADNEILLGSRLHRDSENVWEKPEEAPNKTLRQIAGYIFSAITKILTTIKVRDNQSGFKLYPAALAKYLFGQLKTKGWAHDVELLYKADLNRFKITEMPVRCENRTGSKISVFKDSVKMLFQTVWVSLLVRFQYYLSDPAKLFFGKTITLPPVKEEKVYRREARFRFLFCVTTILMFILMPMLSKDYSLSGDEWIQNQYGHEVYNYFAHGDSTAYSEIGRNQSYDAIIYYSGGYELLLVTVAKFFPHVFEYDVRHFLDALMGCLLFLFTALLAKRLGGWRTGFVALLLIWLSPRLFGESMNNSKDIPFALGMVFTLYHLIPFLRDLPHPRWRSGALLTLGIGLTLNIRIGGLLLYAYIGLFTALIYLYKMKKGEIKSLFSSDFNRLLLMYAVIVVISYFLGVLTWPYALQDPVSNPLLSMEKMTNFPVTIRVLFDGRMIPSSLPPWNYTLVWISRTSPEIVLALFVVFVALIFKISRHFRTGYTFVLLFSILFPVAYAIYKHSALYDGWRHFLFIYPSIAICAAMTFTYLVEISKKKMIRSALGALLAIGLLLPVRHLYALHPYQYIYFNDISGGLKAAYTQFETDYYLNSAKESFYTLAKKEKLAALKDTVTVMTNMVKETAEYAKTVSPYIKVIYSKFENRTGQDFDYGIFMSRFMDHDLLVHGGWPPKNAFYVVRREGVPLSAVIKKNSHDDYKGAMAMKANKTDEAIGYFKAYLQTDSVNDDVLARLGLCYLNKQDFPNAALELEKARRFYPSDNTVISLAIAYASMKQEDKALQVLRKKTARIKEEFEFYRDLAMAHEDAMILQSYAQGSQQLLGTYYYYTGIIYGQKGDQGQAATYLNMARTLNPGIK